MKGVRHCKGPHFACYFVALAGNQDQDATVDQGPDRFDGEERQSLSLVSDDRGRGRG
jgi:hypothetical protein